VGDFRQEEKTGRLQRNERSAMSHKKGRIKDGSLKEARKGEYGEKKRYCGRGNIFVLAFERPRRAKGRGQSRKKELNWEKGGIHMKKKRAPQGGGSLRDMPKRGEGNKGGRSPQGLPLFLPET